MNNTTLTFNHTQIPHNNTQQHNKPLTLVLQSGLPADGELVFVDALHVLDFRVDVVLQLRLRLHQVALQLLYGAMMSEDKLESKSLVKRRIFANP